MERWDGATMLSGSDCYPYTIIGIEGEKTIVVQEDQYVHLEGTFQEHNAVFTYHRCATGEVLILRKKKDGSWKSKNGTRFSLGERRYYQSPEF